MSRRATRVMAHHVAPVQSDGELSIEIAQSHPRRPLARSRELVRALRADEKRLDREVRDWVGGNDRELRCYQRKFSSEMRRAPPTAVMRRQACLERVARFDLAFVSDVHSAIPAQNVCAELIERMCHGGPVALVLEIAHVDQQQELDRYLAGKINIHTLEKRLGWGFEFRGYARELALAKEKGIPLIAANTKGTLAERDAAAAKVIAAAAAKYPNHKLVVQFGQLHLGGGHLVTATARALEAAGLSRRMARLFTGSLDVYYDLVGRGLRPQAVRFDDATFCIFANTPRTTLKSYLRYLDPP